MLFRVPPRFAEVAELELRVRGQRLATPHRCERSYGTVPLCTAYALPVPATVPFRVRPSVKAVREGRP